MQITRLYSLPDGQTRCEPIEVADREATFLVDGQMVVVGPIKTSEVTISRTLRENTVRDVHPAPRRQIVIFLRGGAEVETSDGTVTRFGGGDILLAEDVTGAGHIFRGIDGYDERVMAVFPVSNSWTVGDG